MTQFVLDTRITTKIEKISVFNTMFVLKNY